MIACDERGIEKQRDRAKRFGLHRSPNTNTGKLPSELAPPVASPFVGSLNVIKLFHRPLNYEIKNKTLRHDMRRSHKLLQKDSRE